MRWLIVGHGKITANFIEAARGIGHEIVAVAGRNVERVSIYANKNEIEKSGEDLLLLSEGVDAAYIATPHTEHCNGAITLLDNGVPVLCEKPLAVNHRQVEQMVDTAKESNTFEEEKNVAGKAPVNEIKMDDLAKKDSKVEKSGEKKNFILVISDFYYIDSANNLKKDLLKKININKISVKKINNNKYRLLVGPFENFNALKTTYISLNKLGFEGLNIYKE